MKKLQSLFLMICVLNLLMAGGLIAYLFATGRLDGEKSGAIVDLVRHKGTPVKFRETLFDILEPAATRPSTQPATAPGAHDERGPLATSAQERIQLAHQAMEQERLALEAQAQDLRHRQELLEKLQAEVTEKVRFIEQAKKDSEPKAATAETLAKAENFQKSLALYDELKSKQVKDIFLDAKDHDLVAKYLAAMESSRAGKIIGEFKSPEERAFISIVLNRIRTNGTTSALGGRSDVAVAAPSPAPPVP